VNVSVGIGNTRMSVEEGESGEDRDSGGGGR
jgi:hypothetical protein